MNEINNQQNIQPELENNNHGFKKIISQPISITNSTFGQFIILSLLLTPWPMCLSGDEPDCELMSIPIFLIPILFLIPFLGIFIIGSLAASLPVVINWALAIISILFFSFIFYNLKNYFLHKFSNRILGWAMLIISFLIYWLFLFNGVLIFLDKNFQLFKYYQ